MDNQHGKKLPSAVLPTVSGDEYVITETPDGAIWLVDSSGAKRLLTVDEAFPVGTILCRSDNISPASFIGGTWQKIAEGQTIIGASTDYPLGSTGGSETHEHLAGSGNLVALISTVDNHATFDIQEVQKTTWWSNTRVATNGTYAASDVAHSYGANVIGNVDNASSLQPYIAKNYWQRIA